MTSWICKTRLPWAQPYINHMQNNYFLTGQNWFLVINHWTSTLQKNCFAHHRNQHEHVQKFKIPVPYDLVESNKLAPLHEEDWQGDQHRHAIIPCIKHHWEPLYTQYQKLQNMDKNTQNTHALYCQMLEKACKLETEAWKDKNKLKDTKLKAPLHVTVNYTCLRQFSSNEDTRR